MKKSIVHPIICLFLAISTIASAQTNENYIEVHGSAEKKVAPDRISVSITINENGYRRRLLETLEKEMEQALSPVGIDMRKCLKVNDISSSFVHRNRKKRCPVLSKSFTLELTDATKTNQVFLALNNAGIYNVHIEKTEYSRMDSLKIAIKADAMKNAQATAQLMAGSIGQTLGPAIYIYNQENSVDNTCLQLSVPTKLQVSPNYVVRRKKKKDNANPISEESAEYPLNFQDITVSCGVTVRFKLK